MGRKRRGTRPPGVIGGDFLTLQSKTSQNDDTKHKSSSGLWLLEAAHRWLGISIQGKQQSSRRTLGSAKYRLTAFLSIETLWLWVMGLSAESLANTFAGPLMEPFAFISRFLHNTDHAVAVLNLSGSAMEGAIIWFAENKVQFRNPPLLLVTRSGFCSVWTSLTAVVEQAARSDLTWVQGLRYISVMLVLGVLFNVLGRKLASFVLAPLLESYKLVRRKGKTVVDLSETIWDDVLFYVCLFLMLAACLVCHQGVVPYELHDLLSGFFWVPISFAFGQVIEGNAQYESVQWGTWRCNAVACGLLVPCCLLSTHFQSASSFSMYRKFVGSFLGALSSFNGTSSDTAQLLLSRGGRGAAAGNLGLNFLTMALVSFAIRGISQWDLSAFLDLDKPYQAAISLQSQYFSEL